MSDAKEVWESEGNPKAVRDFMKTLAFPEGHEGWTYISLLARVCLGNATV